jgi:four helix bundle protein
MIKSYRDLEVWQKARKLVKEIYTLSQNFPREEQFGLTSQIRRAAISIPSNIAEGHSRQSTKDYISFISIAIGSVAEVDTQLVLAQDLNYISPQDYSAVESNIHSLQQMLHKLRSALKAKLV